MFAIAWRKKGKHESFFGWKICMASNTSIMMKFSQFVRAHLASRQGQTIEHPDTNLLLAFAERNLCQRDRDAILTHLADCPQCREVLALVSEAATRENSSSPRSTTRHSRWPGWRFAATAATLCLIIALVRLPTLFKSTPPSAPSSKPIPLSRPPSPSPAAVVSKAMEREAAQQNMKRRP